MIETVSRRKLLGGLGLLIAAPAIVRVASIMPVKAWEEAEFFPNYFSDDFIDALKYGLTLRIISPVKDGNFLVKTVDPREYVIGWDMGHAHPA